MRNREGVKMTKIKYLYHTIMRRIHRRKGNWQTSAFEYHHNKKKHYKSLLALIVVLLLFNQPVTADTKTEEQQTIETVQRLMKATVKIEPELLSSGTGFYIAPNVIVTNQHVIRKAPSNNVAITRNDGTRCTGTIGYREEKVDLAIITTDCKSDAYLTFSQSVDVGQTVITTGNPAPYDFVASKGIIGAIKYEWLQFDAKINLGSSGGVLANLRGEIVGVVTYKSNADDYTAFALDYRNVKRFVERSGIDGLDQ